jgi:N6-L-threonylcarbamoyladenine synthase
MIVLGIETSCDDCSVALVRCRGPNQHADVLGVQTLSQANMHQPFGGIVPEIASRTHLEDISACLERLLALEDFDLSTIDAIAVTQRPGLVGSLLVGVSTAKALSYSLQKPLIPVHHLEGHIASLSLHSSQVPQDCLARVPILILLVSGGHTFLLLFDKPPSEWPENVLENAILGRTRDDAAGEAFDKTSKYLGFPYPGGAALEEAAKLGDPHYFTLTRALPQKKTLDFSFSGLKTESYRMIEDLRVQGKLDSLRPHLAASIQEAITDALCAKVKLALETHSVRTLAVVGGVAANRSLTKKLQATALEAGIEGPFSPEPRFCTDNAAMIAAAGGIRRNHALTGESLLRLSATSQTFGAT